MTIENTKKIQFPPLSDKFGEGISTKNQWLVRYSIFRDTTPRSSFEECSKFIESMGKNSSPLADRFRGSLIGLAVGDAMGTTLEFSERPEEELHVDITGGGPFNLKPGQWTDDTSMALCLAYSLLSKKSFDPQDQMTLYTKWRDHGLFSSTGSCFDIGNTVSQALHNYQKTADPFSGSTEQFSAGNGSLMRLAPIVLHYLSSPSDAIKNAGLSSKTTHGAQEAVDSCRYFAAVMIGALQGKRKQEILADLFSPTEGYWEYYPLCKSVEKIAKGSYKSKSRDAIKSSGYVIDSLEAAMWAFYNSESFETGLVKAVNLGGDADTIGAIYGQLAGAYYGETAIPFQWIKILTNFHDFYYIADEMVMYYAGPPI